MKSFVSIFLLFFGVCGILKAQDYCDNFKIATVLDFPPSGQLPGGNFFLLLLTLHEDDPNISTGYANLFFIDDLGDTLSIPTGPSSHLPLYKTDTIPYVLKINATMNNQDFPKNFNGKLVIINPSHPDCEIDYTKIITAVNHKEVDKYIFNVFPNPFNSQLILESYQQIDRVTISNELGQIVKHKDINGIKGELQLDELNVGLFYLIIQFKDGTSTTKKIVKTQ